MLKNFFERGISRRALVPTTAGTAFGLKLALEGRFAEAAATPWEAGKYQTFPRVVVGGSLPLLDVDLGTLGPDVDTIWGFDFPGIIPSGAFQVFASANPTETRVVGIKRVDLETVQFRDVLGGDRFDIYRVSAYGGDATLDAMARLHAMNTARKHQIVYYIGDLGLFETQYGAGEQTLLQRMIRAQRPARAGLPDADFVNPRTF